MNSLTIMTRESKKEGIALEHYQALTSKKSEYDIALCSHFFVLYSEHYDYQFYTIQLEMLRVSKDAYFHHY